ncbi:MAG: hypothetical protein OHK0015_54490 [Chloroflexi bacterium OHK40]
MLLVLLYALDRLLRLVALQRFFRRPPPPAPDRWPAVTLIQPVTRAEHDLRAALASRLALGYPASVQHLVVCDAADHASQALVRELAAVAPAVPVQLLTVEPDTGRVASKVAKLRAAIPHATGEVLCCVDDDVTLPPEALETLVRHLGTPGAGAVFGLARYTAWETPWSSLMSLFVNAWALPSYVPLSLLTEPYTITGHCFALRREVFMAAGGLDGMDGRLDDDHELARRVRSLGLRCVQTPLVYAAENRFASFGAYHAQLRRWFVFPRQALLPQLTPRERAITALGSAGNFLPPLALAVALASRRPSAGGAALACLALFLACYGVVDRRYLGGETPPGRWPLLPLTALLTPLHILCASLGGEVVEWRGQRIRALRGGGFVVLGDTQAGQAGEPGRPSASARLRGGWLLRTLL